MPNLSQRFCWSLRSSGAGNPYANMMSGLLTGCSFPSQCSALRALAHWASDLTMGGRFAVTGVTALPEVTYCHCPQPGNGMSARRR